MPVCLLCLVYVHVFMRGMDQNTEANSVIWLREKCIVCLSLELQQIECALTHSIYDLYVKADRGHILIAYDLISSYQTPLLVPHSRFTVSH